MNPACIEKGNAVDQAIECLASVRRRHLLRYLLEEPATYVEREEVASYLCDERSDPSNVELALVHHHLPKLEEAGLIEYDHRSGGIRPTEAVEDLEPLLAATEALCTDWG